MKRVSSPLIFESFQYRDFRWLWLGSFANFMALGMQMMAGGWLVLQLSSDSPNALFLSGVMLTILAIVFTVENPKFRKID